MPSLPARLIVPSIDVDSLIEYSGVTPTGNMATPSNIAKTGWYKLGPLPGNKGSAVMAGHVNGPQGQPGVFARLAELRAGDTIETVDTNGLSAIFKVQHTKRYGKDDQPKEVFHSAQGSHLNLITCVGDWDEAENQYSERLVVFADKL
ncbi:MAG TPA: class F sortase [Candidatus Saccharimonadales bacterium]